MRSGLSPSKWVLDPTRDWVRSLAVQPYLHRIHGAPEGARRHDEAAMFFHFKGINTNWKEKRTGSGPAIETLVKDEQLALASAAFRAAVEGTIL